MLMNEVCKSCKITRKAIEYYVSQGLLYPSITENGYRDFSDEDIELLKKIATLRKLELSLKDIKEILCNHNPQHLCQVINDKSVYIDTIQEKQELLIQLANGNSWDEIGDAVEVLDHRQTIIQKLRYAFPGYLGKSLSIHFSQFLNEPIISKDQEDAYDRMIEFIDNLDDLIFPEDVQSLIDEMSKEMDDNLLRDNSSNLIKAVENIEDYMEKNQESLNEYITYRESNEYKESVVYRMQNVLKGFYQSSGYYEVFIPSMKILSKSYREYQDKLEEANKIFMSKYPQTKDWQN